MKRVVFDEQGISVDALLVGEAFGVPPATVLDRIRAGEISALSERGVGEDAGRFRVTFLLGATRLQLLVDDAGNILERSLRRRARRANAAAPLPAGGIPSDSGGTQPHR